ncbi:hypothetical protein [Desulfocurvus sp. DL9XJH121]
MHGMRVWRAATLCLALGLALVPADGGIEGSPRADFTDCAACHAGIEHIGPGHPESCATCHLPPGLRASGPAAHEDIIANPGAPEHADAACGPCHPAEVRGVRASPHATLAGLIERTRAQWGARARPAAAPYGVGPDSTPPPPGAPAPRSPAMLVDDFLRMYCLRCHLGERGPDEPGLRRSRGCGACHMAYAADGRYAGGDAALAGAPAGRPARHELRIPRDGAPCLACHRGNHTGADLHGLFQLDPACVGPGSGNEHRLARDVHVLRGMRCPDCHDGRRTMGLGGEPPSCRGCHGGAAASASGGRIPLPPRPRPNTPGHDPELHARVRCEACHAQWFQGDYGLDVLCLDALPRDARIARALARGDDGPHHGVRILDDPRTPGRRWIAGWRMRRWEHAPLGLDNGGRIAALRPRHQAAVSYVSPSGRVVMDAEIPPGAHGLAAFEPYTPHTVGPRGRLCTDCHRSSLAAGLGLDGGEGRNGTHRDEAFDILRAGPEGSLPRDARQRLLDPGGRWAEEFSRHLGAMLEER